MGGMRGRGEGARIRHSPEDTWGWGAPGRGCQDQGRGYLII